MTVEVLPPGDLRAPASAQPTEVLIRYGRVRPDVANPDLRELRPAAIARVVAGGGVAVSWVSYVDESIDDAKGVYILAAATLEVDGTDQSREAVRALGPSPGQRFHWKDQKTRERRAAAAMVAELAALHVVVIGMPMTTARQERARRQVPRHVAVPPRNGRR